MAKLNEGTDKCVPKAERIYNPTFKQLLINCLRKDANLLTIRDHINGTLNRELAAAIDNDLIVTQVVDAVAGKIQQITRQEAEKILRANSADFEGQVPTDPPSRWMGSLTTSPSKPSGITTVSQKL